MHKRTESLAGFALMPALTLAGACALTAGCASGPLAPPPPVTQPGAAATVSVKRQNSIVGLPATMFFIINDQRVYALQNGQGWSFRIDPGEHRLGYDLGFNSCRQRVILKPNGRYLVELTPVCDIEARQL